jgi:hypothetical protein
MYPGPFEVKRPYYETSINRVIASAISLPCERCQQHTSSELDIAQHFSSSSIPHNDAIKSLLDRWPRSMLTIMENGSELLEMITGNATRGGQMTHGRATCNYPWCWSQQTVSQIVMTQRFSSSWWSRIGWAQTRLLSCSAVVGSVFLRNLAN